MGDTASEFGFTVPDLASNLGDYYQGQWNFDQQTQANQNAASQAEQFSANQSSTSWQRGVADMRAAGINPAVAYSQGGASSAMGVQAQSAPLVDQGNSRLDLGNPLDNQQKMANIDQTQAQTLQTTAATANTIANTKNLPLQGDLWRNNALLAAAQVPVTVQSAAQIAAKARLENSAATGQDISNQVGQQRYDAEQGVPGYRTAQALTGLASGVNSAASAATSLTGLLEAAP